MKGKERESEREREENTYGNFILCKIHFFLHVNGFTVTMHFGYILFDETQQKRF